MALFFDVAWFEAQLAERGDRPRRAGRPARR